MVWNGMKNVSLTICPFKYKPLAKKIRVLKEFVVTINFTGGTDGTPTGALAGNSQLLTKGLNNYNYEIVQSYTSNPSGISSLSTNNSYDYLIIMPNSPTLYAYIQPFIQWKRQKGFKCNVVYLSNATTGTTCTSIKKYIRDEYSKGVKYVLFVGDTNFIPIYHWIYGSGESKSDYWYGCMDGDEDYQADIAIGRFCIGNNATDLIKMINKSVQYEKNPPQDSWVQKCLLVAHKEMAPGKYQGCSEEIRTWNYKIETPNFYKAYGALSSKGGTSATNQIVVNHINSGVGLVNYRGHGSPLEWDRNWCYDNIGFGTSQVNQLTNTTKTPVVFSLACQNGNITNPAGCLLETFSNSAAGSVAFLGATEDSWTNANHLLDKFLFRTIYDKGIYNIGLINNLAQIENINYNSNSIDAVSNAFAYLWGGDPTLEIWTDNISTFSNVIVNRQENSISVNTNGVADCTITVVEANNIASSAYFSCVKGQSYAEFSNVIFPCYITVSKHNYIPYILYVTDSNMYIQNETISQDMNKYGQNIYIGSDVTTGKAPGKVTIQPDVEVQLKGSNSVYIKNDFEVKKGATLKIDAGN